MTRACSNRGLLAAALGVAWGAALGCSKGSAHDDDTAGTGGSTAAGVGGLGAGRGAGGSAGSGAGGAASGGQSMGGSVSAGSGGTTGGRGGAGAGGKGTAGQAGAEVLSLCPGRSATIAKTGTLPEGATLLTGAYSSTKSFLYLEANDEYVFWGDNDSLHRTTIADGSDMVFFEPDFPQSVQGIHVDGPTLYLSVGGPNSIGVAKMPADGSAEPTSLDPSPVYNWCILADGFIYYGTQHSSIARVPVDGGESTDVVTTDDLGALRTPIVAGNALWFRLGNDDMSHIEKVSLDEVGAAGAGGATPEPTALATTTYHGAPLVTDGTNIYYGDNPGLMKLPIAGGGASVFVTPPAGGLGYVFGLSDGIIWSEGKCGPVHHTKTDGSELTPILQMAEAGPFAVNSTDLFVAIGGQIVRVPLP